MTPKPRSKRKRIMEETINPQPEGIDEPLDRSPATEEVVAEALAFADLQETITSLQAELAEAQAKVNEYLDGWQRSRAEFSNFRKRMERDQATASQVAAGNIIKRFLDVVDDLDRALKNRPQDVEGSNWAGGIDLIYHKLLTNLETEGVQVIQADGQFFDPTLHEAISHEDSPEIESGKVISVVQQGYILGDRVLRPARVRVAR
jgi:molecular chaperone GrpE